MRVDFNVNILNNLLYQYPDRVLDASMHFSKLKAWQEQKEKPTFKQLTDLADYFSIPFGYFFLDEIPSKIYPIPHYRTIKNEAFKPSSALIETIETLQERQEWVKDILIEIGADPLPFANSFNLKSSVVSVAKELHKILDLPSIWCANSGWNDAFRLLIEKTEKAGIFVVVNGVLGNNTHATLDVNEFRGFVLYDNYAPFVFINGKDFITGKIFTLIHEIVHVVIGQSASFDLENLMVPDEPIEKFCNAVAAEFLVPETELKKAIEENGVTIEYLAKKFKVSRLVIARRLLDLKYITKEIFFYHYNHYKQTEISPIKTPGGDFYNTVPYRISKKFFSIIHGEVRQNKMLYRDAFRLTGLSPKSFDGYVNKYLS